MTSRDCNAWHTPVLLEETIEALAVHEDGLYLDMTCGGGGHSAEILMQLGEKGRLYAADRDAVSVRICEERLFALKATGQFRTVAAPFSALTRWLPEEDRGKVNGLLADLGVSSHQLDNAERGFSYLHDGPLDMRMDQSQEETAEKLIASLTQDELTCVFRTYGEEQYAARIARAIVLARREAPIRTTGRLAEIVAHAVPPKARRGGHPARRVFQAVRMAVNHEYDELSTLLEQYLTSWRPADVLSSLAFIRSMIEWLSRPCVDGNTRVNARPICLVCAVKNHWVAPSNVSRSSRENVRK